MSLEQKGVRNDEYLSKIPNFVVFLDQFGETMLIDYGEQAKHNLVSRFQDPQFGKLMSVYIGKILIGKASFYNDPTIYNYYGIIPTLRSKSKDNKILLAWSDTTGRTDNWDLIPFP